MAEALATATGRKLASAARYARHGDIGPRAASEIGVQTIRGGDVVGDHTVFFLGNGDRLEITHRATTRDTFAVGAVRAAPWLAGRTAGIYDMRAVLGLASEYRTRARPGLGGTASDFARLATEAVHPRAARLDTLAPEAIAELMLAEEAKAVKAVQRARGRRSGAPPSCAPTSWRPAAGWSTSAPGPPGGSAPWTRWSASPPSASRRRGWCPSSPAVPRR